MKKPYNGPLGSFDKGSKYDLSENIVSQLPKRSYKKTRAPWDEQKDNAAFEKDNLLAEANIAIAAAEKSQAEAEQAAKALSAFAEQLVAANKAAQTVKGQNQKDRAVQKIILELHKATGQNDVLSATAALKQLEAEDAVTKAIELAEKAGITWPPKDTTEDAGVSAGQTDTARQTKQ